MALVGHTNLQPPQSWHKSSNTKTRFLAGIIALKLQNSPHSPHKVHKSGSTIGYCFFC